MKAAKAKKPVRDTIRDTLTPSRVGLLSWAFAAIAMGSVGMASYKFASITRDTSQAAYRFAGIPLPPAGDVASTASVRPLGGEPIEVMQIPGGSSSERLSALGKSQIEVLQDQIARLRRRVSTLTEQNAGYSRRLAALETETSRTSVAGAVADLNETKTPNATFLSGSDTPDLADASKVKREMAPLPKPRQQAAAETPVLTASAQKYPDRHTVSRQIKLYADQQNTASPVATAPQEPVKMVELPSADNKRILTTGSIPQSDVLQPVDSFESTPTSTTFRPKVISPSSGVGTLKGGGNSKLKRSDFGAIVGRYSSLAEAANAWSKFREQNEERMQDLRPMIKSQPGQDNVSLLIGPFGNAADAAAACFYLLDVTDVCQPALYAGTPMIAASDFPNSDNLQLQQ